MSCPLWSLTYLVALIGRFGPSRQKVGYPSYQFLLFGPSFPI